MQHRKQRLSALLGLTLWGLSSMVAQAGHAAPDVLPDTAPSFHAVGTPVQDSAAEALGEPFIVAPSCCAGHGGTHFKGRYVDAIVHVGARLPGGALFNDANVGPTFGGGIGKELHLLGPIAIRGALSYDYNRFGARRANRSGALTVHGATARLDVLFGHKRGRPFVGGGVGVYPWHGSIIQPSDGQVNQRKHTDFGGNLFVGADIYVDDSLSLSPELSWTHITGDFSQMLWGAELAARWRF